MCNNTAVNKIALSASEFEKIFQKANVLTDVLSNAKSARSKATKIGNFLGPHVGREVVINVDGRTGKAKLCVTNGRANKKLYYFETRWDDPDAVEQNTAAASKLDDGLGATADHIGVVENFDAGKGDDQQPAGDSGGNNEEWE